MTTIELLLIVLYALAASVWITDVFKSRRKAKAIFRGDSPASTRGGEYDIDALDALYPCEQFTFFDLDGGEHVDLSHVPFDPFFTPIAMAMEVHDDLDPALPRRAWLLRLRIGDFDQWHFRSEDVATAISFMPSEQLDPWSRNGKAMPVRFAAMTKEHPVAVRVGNPHPKGVKIGGVIKIWGIPMQPSCCPPFVARPAVLA